MAITPGTRIGSYDVIGLLGAGGMGQVYRARDLKLERDVALKILPESFATDPDRLRRFEREAKTLASLNHPNIAQIYGIENFGASGTALVMELVPGPTLEELIRDTFERRHSRFDLAEVVAMASSIAEALEAAHEAGIVHRDLKPANIKRRDDHVVKVLDFGLARVVDPSGPGELAGAASSPTMLSPAATQQGIILGTAGYMSPEQAKGRAVDKRADIWAFGVVLYQMLTGKQLFGGESVTEIIASVIKDAPDLRALPADTPPTIRHLLARCLERDPRLRLRDIGEARIQLQRATDPQGWFAGPGMVATDAPPGAADPGMGATGPRTAKTPPLPRLALTAGAIVLAAISAAVAWNVKPESATTTVPVRRFEFPAAIARAAEFAVSPDGSRIAYLTDGHLYVRNLNQADSTDLGQVPPGSEGIFFSHDSQRVAYGAETTLRAVPVEGGAAFTICKLPARGRVIDGLWQPDGTIYVALWRDSLYTVAATGGTPAIVSAIDSATEIDFHSVTALPDRRLIVTTHLRGQDAARTDLIDNGKRAPLSEDPDIDRVRFRAPNLLLFGRSRANVGVWMAPFESSGLTWDLPRAVLLAAGATSFDASFEGTLVARLPARERRELVWIGLDQPGSGASPTRTAKSTWTMPGAPFESASSSVVLSPDGRRALITSRSATGQEELLVRELTTGTDTRVPAPQASTGMTTGARITWTPGGRLLYAAGGVESSQIYDWPSDGSSSGRLLVAGISARITPDGRELLFTRDDRSAVRLYRASMLPDGSVGKAELLLPGADQPSVRWFDLSADGRLLTFTTSEPTTGQTDVFVTTYPDVRVRVQVTSSGGTQPRFSRDGRQLFYLAGTRTTVAGLTQGELRVVTISGAGTSAGTGTSTPPAAPGSLTLGAPRVLLSESTSAVGGPTLSGFDVAADGRLLMTRIAPTAPGDEARLVLLQNWMGAGRK